MTEAILVMFIAVLWSAAAVILIMETTRFVTRSQRAWKRRSRDMRHKERGSGVGGSHA